MRGFWFRFHLRIPALSVEQARRAVDDLIKSNALEKSILEPLVTLTCDFNQRGVSGFAANMIQQRIAYEVGITEEPLIDAFFQQPQGRRFVSQHAVALRQFVTQLSIAKWILIKLVLRAFQ